MKKLLIALILFIPFSFLPAQQQTQSYFGGVHTPKGRLHMLLIFVRYEDQDLMAWDKQWPNSSDLPKMAEGANNDLFYATPEPLLNGERKQNISDFYYTMSGGKFIITADVFPEQVPVTYVPEAGSNFFRRQGQLNQAAVQWITENYPGFDWSRYDNRTNNPSYRYDNSESQPDSILDYVMFLHRAPGGQTGMGASSNFAIPGTPYRVQNGHTGIKVYTGAKHNWEYFKHEFSHNLFSCPHYMGANHTAGNRIYVQKGWGLMSAGAAPFFTANAWERWWLDWYEPQTLTTPGTYTLRDFVTTGDAIRIQIPGTRDYLWIENHQKQDIWDDRMFYQEPDKYPVSGGGVYLYVVGEAGADRNKSLAVFNPAHCNLMKLLNGQGHWDWAHSGDKVDVGFTCNALMRTAPNPIWGQNDLQAIRGDFNGDGKIPIAVNHGNTDARSGEMEEVWAETVQGIPRASYNIMGDQQDPFRSGDEVSLSGILPALNYPVYDPRKEELSPVYLNGLRIWIGEKDDSGTYTLNVSFDDWEVRNPQRWCGNIVLPSIEQEDKRYLEIAEGTTLTLDLSGTPDRSTPHPETGTFANPSRLKVEAGRGIHLNERSTLVIDQHSLLELTGNSQIVIERRAELIVRGQGQLVLGDESKVVVKRGGRLTIEADGRLRQVPDAVVEAERGSRIRIQ